VTGRILLADDDESQRISLGILLEDEGFVVDVVASFAAARARIEGPGAAYDLVILDQHLGDGLGSSLVPLVRARIQGAAVMLVSGSVTQADRAIAGIDAVIAKGMAFPDLLEIVRETLARAAALE
jgi:two-component system response regulator RegA